MEVDREPVAAPRGRYIAMQFGDNSWIRGLIGRPELNGKRVVLREWKQEEQRWRCEPVGWRFEQEFVSVKAKNLHNEPPPKQSVSPPPSPDLAVNLVRLVEREGQLRTSASHGLECRLKHLLCMRELLGVQQKILECRHDKTLAQEANEKLQAHERELEAAQASWRAAGGMPLDFWCDE